MKPTIINLNKAYRAATIAVDPQIAGQWADVLYSMHISFKSYYSNDGTVALFQIDTNKINTRQLSFLYEVEGLSVMRSWLHRQIESMQLKQHVSEIICNGEIEEYQFN